MHRVLSQRPVQMFLPIVEHQTAKFLNRLLNTPEQLVDHIRQFVTPPCSYDYCLILISYFSTAAAIVLKISHGYTVLETERDPFVTLAETTLEEFSLSTAPGAFLVDVLPWRELKACLFTKQLSFVMTMR